MLGLMAISLRSPSMTRPESGGTLGRFVRGGSVSAVADPTTAGRLVHTVAVETAKIGTYGVPWLIPFVVCDRLVFATPSPSERRPVGSGREGTVARGPGRTRDAPRPHPDPRPIHPVGRYSPEKGQDQSTDTGD